MFREVVHKRILVFFMPHSVDQRDDWFMAITFGTPKRKLGGANTSLVALYCNEQWSSDCGV